MPPFPSVPSTMPAPAPCSRGFDLSKFSGDVNFRKFKDDGFDFVIIRASVDLTVDPRFIEYVKGARDVDFIIGPYHGFFDNADPFRQAQIFHDVCKLAGLTERSVKTLLPSNDYEKFHASEHPTYGEKALGATRALVFQEEIEKLWKIDDSIFYTYPSFFDEIPNDCSAKEELAKRKLWISHFGAAPQPRVPHPFPQWVLWQYLGDTTQHGSLIDLNYCNGGIDALPLLIDAPVAQEQGLQLDTPDVAVTTIADEVNRNTRGDGST